MSMTIVPGFPDIYISGLPKDIFGHLFQPKKEIDEFESHNIEYLTRDGFNTIYKAE
ncbi:32995_t:CDS:2 [Gigaspora margarita]|uniref:32995_t:CDS:1 n=1 Tax=Gigaspora margarita TaxID=4874 RepID=A0ABM8W5Q6_GIGMA|nr:32995_t:CDS:2 [Gigaspora margarita]